MDARRAAAAATRFVKEKEDRSGFSRALRESVRGIHFLVSPARPSYAFRGEEVVFARTTRRRDSFCITAPSRLLRALFATRARHRPPRSREATDALHHSDVVRAARRAERAMRRPPPRRDRPRRRRGANARDPPHARARVLVVALVTTPTPRPRPRRAERDEICRRAVAAARRSRWSRRRPILREGFRDRGCRRRDVRAAARRRRVRVRVVGVAAAARAPPRLRQRQERGSEGGSRPRHLARARGGGRADVRGGRRPRGG